MSEIDRRISKVAARRKFLITREEVLALGGSMDFIQLRIDSNRWMRIHPGVYQIDCRPLDWESMVLAGVLACGPRARASHRAALLLWNMDGIRSAPIEVTMPFGNLAVPDGVIVHRSRRSTPTNTVKNVPVSGPERTLLECCAFLPPIVIGKALDSALRHDLTTPDRLWLILAREGGRGVKGTRRMRRALLVRSQDTATDSGAEYELLHHMQRAQLPLPELGFELSTNNGRRVPDFIWPDRGKAVEVDGVDAHSSADRLDDDLIRQNDLMDMGIELRRFSARRVRREPDRVIDEIRRFLES